MYCNNKKNTRTIGLCFRDSDLIKTLGTKCSQQADRCDRRRGLSCEWIPSERRFGCQQQTIEGFCTPGSKYSTCITSGGPRDCYILRDKGDWAEPTLSFDQCGPMRLSVPIGTVCNPFLVDPLCPKGATCETVLGIDYGSFEGSKGPTTASCLYMKSVGEDCGDKFKTKCRDGLKCEIGLCVNGTEPCCTSTHADVGITKSIPGAECVNGFCQRSEKAVLGLNEQCNQYAGSYDKVSIRIFIMHLRLTRSTVRCYSPLFCDALLTATFLLFLMPFR